MTMVLTSMIGALLTVAAPQPAAAGDAPFQHRHGDQDAALAARMQGRILPLREIENRVVPAMRGAQYIGFDFNSAAAVYTLKFLRNGTVIWVNVDARSGAVIGRTDR